MALTPAQAKALLTYLTHAQTLYELQSLKFPGRVSNSGPPFRPAPPEQKPSPILNLLFRRLGLSLPGFKDADSSLYGEHIQAVLEALAAENLSDSYDKGIIGKRKIMGLGLVIIAEYAIRGVLGGLPPSAKGKERSTLDPKDAEDILLAWGKFVQDLVYGQQADELVDWAAKTDKLADLPPNLQAAHQFATITFASSLHYFLTLNPAGPTIYTLVKRVHELLPYGLLRQALRMGNAATMINAVLNIFLYKAPSLRGFFSSTAKRSTLLDSIISSVLSQDKTRYEKRLASLSGGQQAQRDAIEYFVWDMPREEQQRVRDDSFDHSISIVAEILKNRSAPSATSDEEHDGLLQRLTLTLALRDRTRLIAVLCESDISEKHLINGIRLFVGAFEPVIRSLHQAVDLPSALTDLQAWLDALFAIPQGSGPDAYMRLTETHQANLHHFLHQIAKNSPDIRTAYLDWYHTCVQSYRRKDVDSDPGGAGDLTGELNILIDSLSPEERAEVSKELDVYEGWLAALSSHSLARLYALQSGEISQVHAGPGLYLARWQATIDATAVTPAKPSSPVRYGADSSVQNASAAVDGPTATKFGSVSASDAVGLAGDVPQMSRTRALLGDKFEELMIKKCL